MSVVRSRFGSFLAVVVTTICAVVAFAVPAGADPVGTEIKPVLWGGRCLTNSSGATVSTVTCTRTPTAAQLWHSSSAHQHELINTKTGRCLMITEVGGILTWPCDAQPAQRWDFRGLPGIGTFQSEYTLDCLASNSSGSVFGAVCSGAGGQTGWSMPSIRYI